MTAVSSSGPWASMSDLAVRTAQTPRWFRAVAVAEAVSWLALIVATIVKYAADAPLGVHILGPVHGVLFVGYVILALEVRGKLAWSTRTTLIVLADSVLPGGGFLVARRADLQRRPA
jgi:integral membrane protein